VKELRSLRKTSGITQCGLARTTGIDRTRIWLIETDHVEPRPEEVQAIRQALENAMRERLGTIQKALASAGSPVGA